MLALQAGRWWAEQADVDDDDEDDIAAGQDAGDETGAETDRTEGDAETLLRQRAKAQN